MPTGRTAARENRAFLGRVVRYLAAEEGIRQFLDIGTGLPTTSNVHEVAQRVTPGSRVVYVDNDPLVLAHARALLTSSPEGRTAGPSRLTTSLSAESATRRAGAMPSGCTLSRIGCLSFFLLSHGGSGLEVTCPGGCRHWYRQPVRGKMPAGCSRHAGHWHMPARRLAHDPRETLSAPVWHDLAGSRRRRLTWTWRTF